jgi:SAM-dependent methyltransferase
METRMNQVPYILNAKYKSLDDLVNRYSPNDLRLDLGCGYYKPAGFIGLDSLIGEGTQIVNEENGPDILIDLNSQALPFADNSCVEVRASHFLEHSNISHIIAETFRVLRPGGEFLFAVPYANSAEGMYPGHLIFLTEKWFKKNIQFQTMFEVFEEEYYPSEDYQQLPWIVRKAIPFSFARKFLFNACWQMRFRCHVKKPADQGATALAA